MKGRLWRLMCVSGAEESLRNTHLVRANERPTARPGQRLLPFLLLYTFRRHSYVDAEGTRGEDTPKCFLRPLLGGSIVGGFFTLPDGEQPSLLRSLLSAQADESPPSWCPSEAPCAAWGAQDSRGGQGLTPGGPGGQEVPSGPGPQGGPCIQKRGCGEAGQKAEAGGLPVRVMGVAGLVRVVTVTWTIQRTQIRKGCVEGGTARFLRRVFRLDQEGAAWEAGWLPGR